MFKPGSLVRVKAIETMAPALYGAKAVVVEIDNSRLCARIFIKFATPIEIRPHFIVDSLWIDPAYIAMDGA